MRRINVALWEKVKELKTGMFIKVIPWQAGQIIRSNFVERGPNFIVLKNHDANFAPRNKEIVLKLDDILDIEIFRN